MKWPIATLRILLAWSTLVLAQVLAGLAVRISPPGMAHQTAWVAGTNLLVCVALGFVALRSDWRGWRLGLSLIAIPLSIYIVDIIEAIIFLHMESGPALLGRVVLTYLFALPFWVLIFGKSREVVYTSYRPFESRGLGRNVGMFLAADISYIILYLAAGMVIFPFVRDFYATKTLPTMGTILALQLLCRGPVFVATCLLLLRMLNLQRAAAALAVGMVFTTVSGIAPLLMPNPYFPDSVRWFHFFEVVISNFLFGGIVAWFWRGPKLQSLSENHAA
jgi:hypothetical protein